MAVQIEGLQDGLQDACGVDDTSRVCSRVFDWTDNETLAGLAEWVIDRPFRILVIVVGAWILNRIARRAIGALSDRVRQTPDNPRIAQLRRLGAERVPTDKALADRAPARAEAIESVLKSLVTVAIWSIAVLLILGELNINLAPLIAGAGIAGIALGFGAQSMVRDFLGGLFILIEDQYGVGDVIEVDDIAGTVEDISLRSTRVRDVEGTVWHIANGEISKVGNHSQLWSNCVIDVDIAYDTDVREAMQVLDDTADAMWREAREHKSDVIIADPVVQGVQALGESAITLRLVVKTDPLSQWQVQRELRLRIKEAFDAAGIAIPFPQRTVRVVNAAGGAAPAQDAVADAAAAGSAD